MKSNLPPDVMSKKEIVKFCNTYKYMTKIEEGQVYYWHDFHSRIEHGKSFCKKLNMLTKSIKYHLEENE